MLLTQEPYTNQSLIISAALFPSSPQITAAHTQQSVSAFHCFNLCFECLLFLSACLSILDIFMTQLNSSLTHGFILATLVSHTSPSSEQHLCLQTQNGLKLNGLALLQVCNNGVMTVQHCDVGQVTDPLSVAFFFLYFSSFMPVSSISVLCQNTCAENIKMLMSFLILKSFCFPPLASGIESKQVLAQQLGLFKTSSQLTFSFFPLRACLYILLFQILLCSLHFLLPMIS